MNSFIKSSMLKIISILISTTVLASTAMKNIKDSEYHFYKVDAITQQVVGLLRLSVQMADVIEGYFMKLKGKNIFLLITPLLLILYGCGGEDSLTYAPQASDEAIVEKVNLPSSNMSAKVSSDSIELKWKSNDGVKYNELIIREDKIEIDTITLSKDELSYIDYNVKKNITYTYELNSFNESGEIIFMSLLDATINEYVSYKSDEVIY